MLGSMVAGRNHEVTGRNLWVACTQPVGYLPATWLYNFAGRNLMVADPQPISVAMCVACY